MMYLNTNIDIGRHFLLPNKLHNYYSDKLGIEQSELVHIWKHVNIHMSHFQTLYEVLNFFDMAVM